MLRNIVQFSTNCLKVVKLPNVVKVTSTNSYIQVQNYSRFTSRRPAAIVNEDELFDVPEAAYPLERKPFDSESSSRRRSRKPTRREKAALRQFDVEEGAGTGNYEEMEHSSEAEDIPLVKTSFTKLYDNEKLLSPLMIQIRSKKQRKKLNKILLEGTRLITDALEAGMIPESIIYSRVLDLKKLPIPKENTIAKYKVPYRTIQLWSTLTTPSGLMGVFPMPNVESYVANDSLPITILCDNIRDPGNMGSILRAAAGVGCDRVILSKGCVDIWDSKVLRSAAGAHFRLPIFSEKSWDDIRTLLSPQSKFVVADNQVDNELPNDNDNFDNIEHQDFTHDIDEENVPNWKLAKYKRTDLSKQLSVVPYFSVDYTQSETVIIVGGETEGLSEFTFKIANDNGGVRVNIPLNNGVESLNSGMALGIIAFEIKRQFLNAAVDKNQ